MMAGWIKETVFPVSRGLPAKAGSTSMKKGASNPAAPSTAALGPDGPSCLSSDFRSALHGIKV